MSEKRNKRVRAMSKPELLQVFIFIFCLLVLLLLTYVVGVLLYNKGAERGTEETRQAIDPDKYFKDCQLVEAKCLDIGCGYYSRCGDGHYEACRIYDCGDTLGVYTEDESGAQKTDRQAKPDKAALAAKKESCKGSMQTLSDSCVGGEEKIKVKIATEGECKIVGFTVIYDETTTRPNTFAPLGEGTYEITAQSCGKVTRIVPATTGGVALEF